MWVHYELNIQGTFSLNRWTETLNQSTIITSDIDITFDNNEHFFDYSVFEMHR